MGLLGFVFVFWSFCLFVNLSVRRVGCCEVGGLCLCPFVLLSFCPFVLLSFCQFVCAESRVL